tara:strand:- start:588 stop:833 length:246 start_codon:yes stop_codon:yes gene_type:complete
MGQAYSNYIEGGGGSYSGGSGGDGMAQGKKNDMVQQQQEEQKAKYISQTPNLETASEGGKGAFDTSMNRYDFMGSGGAPHF